MTNDSILHPLNVTQATKVEWPEIVISWVCLFVFPVYRSVDFINHRTSSGILDSKTLTRADCLTQCLYFKLRPFFQVNPFGSLVDLFGDKFPSEEEIFRSSRQILVRKLMTFNGKDKLFASPVGKGKSTNLVSVLSRSIKSSHHSWGIIITNPSKIYA